LPLSGYVRKETSFKVRKVISKYYPDGGKVDIGVFVRQDIPHPDQLMPWNVTALIAIGTRKSLCFFGKLDDGINSGVLDYPIVIESLSTEVDKLLSFIQSGAHCGESV